MALKFLTKGQSSMWVLIDRLFCFQFLEAFVWGGAGRYTSQMKQSTTLSIGFSISRSEVRDQKPFPSFSEQALTGVYVDNISIIGKTKDQVKSAASKIERAFAELNIPLTWSSDEPQDTFTTVGIVLDFRQRKVLVKPRRLWKVFLAGREIFAKG